MDTFWTRRSRHIFIVAAAAAVLVVGAGTLLQGSRGAASPIPLPLPPDGPAGLRIVPDEGGRELVVIYGPIDLPANSTHHDLAQPGPRVGSFPADGWIHGYHVEIVDAADRPVPRTVLHHINLIMPDGRELFSNIMRRIGAAGHETDPVRLPRFVGLPVERGQQLLVTAMMHNPTDQDYEQVYLRTRIPFTPSSAKLPRLSIYPFYLDVMPPAGKHAYDLPPGYSEQSWEGRPAVAGRILGVGGHLHRYGKVLRLEDVTAGKVLWEAEPYLDEAGEVVGMPTRKWLLRFGIPLRPDRVYRLTAVYENPTGEVIPDGGMGALGGVVWLRRGQRWPSADPDHPEYIRDLEVVNESSHGHGGHEHGDHAEAEADEHATHTTEHHHH